MLKDHETSIRFIESVSSISQIAPQTCLVTIANLPPLASLQTRRAFVHRSVWKPAIPTISDIKRISMNKWHQLITNVPARLVGWAVLALALRICLAA